MAPLAPKPAVIQTEKEIGITPFGMIARLPVF
jgi:hypothetical protein